LKDLIGTWLVEDTYVDSETKFLITQTNRVYGKLHDAMDDTIFHKNTQQIKISFYSPENLVD